VTQRRSNLPVRQLLIEGFVLGVLGSANGQNAPGRLHRIGFAVVGRQHVFRLSPGNGAADWYREREIGDEGYLWRAVELLVMIGKLHQDFNGVCIGIYSELA
jgi:hypothetical protein